MEMAQLTQAESDQEGKTMTPPNVGVLSPRQQI